MQQVDTPQNLYDYPCNMFVAGFIGSPQMNFINAVVAKKGSGYTLNFDKYEVPVPADKVRGDKLHPEDSKGDALAAYVGKEVIFGIRPEHVHDEAEELSKAIMQFDANVDVTELMGAEIYLYVNIAGQPITARVDPTSTSKVGDKIKVCFSLDKLHIFDKETEQVIAN